jgi:hypothetical protein
MRNCYAEYALNEDMYYLMLEYQKEHAHNLGDRLAATLELLKNTSAIVKLFRSHMPIQSLLDERLASANTALDWFKAWEIANEKEATLERKQKWRAVISREAREDLQSSVVGMNQLVKLHTEAFPGGSIRPFIVNTDVVENIFCQQRACHNGAMTHPNLYQYRYTLNSIFLSAGLYSTKGNASGNDAAADPYCFHLPKPFSKKKAAN